MPLNTCAQIEKVEGRLAEWDVCSQLDVNEIILLRVTVKFLVLQTRGMQSRHINGTDKVTKYPKPGPPIKDLSLLLITSHAVVLKGRRVLPVPWLLVVSVSQTVHWIFLTFCLVIIGDGNACANLRLECRIRAASNVHISWTNTFATMPQRCFLTGKCLAILKGTYKLFQTQAILSRRMVALHCCMQCMGITYAVWKLYWVSLNDWR